MEAAATPTPGVTIPGIPGVPVPGIPGVSTELYVGLVALLLGMAVVFVGIGWVRQRLAAPGPREGGEEPRPRYEGREARIAEQAEAVRQGLAAAYAAGDLDQLLDDLARRVVARLDSRTPPRRSWP
jgi:hypothetical protein